MKVFLIRISSSSLYSNARALPVGSEHRTLMQFHGYVKKTLVYPSSIITVLPAMTPSSSTVIVPAPFEAIFCCPLSIKVTSSLATFCSDLVFYHRA